MAERKQNGKKETKHVNNAESKNQKEQIKIRQKGETTIPDRCTGVETQKHRSKQNILRPMVDGMRMASSMHLNTVGVHTDFFFFHYAV